MSSLETVHSLQRKLMLLDLLSSAKLSKSVQTFATQIEPKNVVHFFKCMDSTCDFTTDDRDVYLIHLSAHWENTFPCSYCSEVICTDVQLIQHMVTNHSDRTFQCAFCFYRARTKPHLVVHFMSVHKSNPVYGYVCTKTADIPPLEGPGDTGSKYYVCALDKSCRFSRLSTGKFLAHLTEKHSDASCYVCHKCSYQGSDPEGLISHYHKEHHFMPYQCLYCSFGSNDEWKIMEHISQEHADYLFKLLVRSCSPPVWFKQISAMMRECKLLALPEGGDSQQTCEGVCTKIEPFCDSAVEPVAHSNSELSAAVTNPPETSSYLPASFICSVENCAYSCDSPTTFLKHITEDHTSVSEFSCPCCSFLQNASSSEFYVHLVDNHTTLLRCPYKNCTFVGHSKGTVDAHIMSVHQQYDEEPEDQGEHNPDYGNAPTEEGLSSPQLPYTTDACSIDEKHTVVKAEECYEPQEREGTHTVPQPVVEHSTTLGKWLSDTELKEIAERERTLEATAQGSSEEQVATTPTTSLEPQGNNPDSTTLEGNVADTNTREGDVADSNIPEGSVADTTACEDNIADSTANFTEEVGESYVCSLCCQSEMEALEYFRHMSHGHGIKYFCGHCDRGYKVHRQLLTHHLRLHSQEEMSFKTFQDNSLMSVPEKVISVWQQDIAKKKKSVIQQEQIVIKHSSKRSHDIPGRQHISHNKTRKSYEYDSKKHDKPAKAAVPGADKNVKHEAVEQRNGQENPLPVKDVGLLKRKSKDVYKKKQKDNISMQATTANKMAGNMPEGSKLRKDKLTSLQGLMTTTVAPHKNQSPRMAKYIPPAALPRESAFKPSKSVLPKENEQKIHTAKPLQPNVPKAREQLVENEVPAPSDSVSAPDTPPNGGVAHVCVYCYKSYKLLAWALRHQKAAHPDKPTMVKLLEVSNLKNSKSKEEASEQLKARRVEPSVPSPSARTEREAPVKEEEIEVITLSDDDDDETSQTVAEFQRPNNVPQQSQVNMVPQRNRKKWRRICLLDSDSDDNEPASLQEFSYYGTKVDPVNTDKVFVYVQRGGGVRIAYTQLATVMKLDPIVLVKKLDMLEIFPSHL